jgi:hypothetical protein
MVEHVEKPKKGLSRKETVVIVIAIVVILVTFSLAMNWAENEGKTSVWNMISDTGKNLRDVHSDSTQTELKDWLPSSQMNFTEGLIWESQLIEYNQDRPKYENATQVLKNGKGACGEFVWVFAAFCSANNIPVRVCTVGYFQPNVVDHSWVQVNPSHDGETWIHVEVTDTCVSLQNGKTIDDLWNVSINNNSYYTGRTYKMVLAYELNQNGEIVITDVTSTFS